MPLPERRGLMISVEESTERILEFALDCPASLESTWHRQF